MAGTSTNFRTPLSRAWLRMARSSISDSSACSRICSVAGGRGPPRAAPAVRMRSMRCSTSAAVTSSLLTTATM